MAAAAPLHLVTKAEGAGVRISVIGAGVPACDARFVLEVVNKSAGGTSRSTQSGTARAKGGVTHTFATSVLASASQGGWAAKLSVDPCGASKDYVETSGNASLAE